MFIFRGVEGRWCASVVGLLAVIAAVAVAGCGSSDDAASGGGEKPQVLTTFTVLADMARNVAGDRVDIASITKPGAEIHGYEPTPSDIRKAAEANLVLDNGLGLERWFEKFLQTSRADHVTLSEGVQPIPIAGESEYAGKPNPHAWMSVGDALIYVENIRKALTELDPDGADAYAANAKRYSARLGSVRDFVKRELASVPESKRALVSCEGDRKSVV